MPRIPTSSAREGDGDKRRGHTFAAVEAIGGALPDVEVTTAWGQPALKVHGKMFVCIASHKSAEPNSLVVMMAFADRDALVEDDPATYYLKDHYLNYPCVLVRLTRIRSTLFGTSWSAHTASSTSRCGASRTPAAAEARLGHHAIAPDRS
jgi:hypothetical protein